MVGMVVSGHDGQYRGNVRQWVGVPTHFHKLATGQACVWNHQPLQTAWLDFA
jgi:hypothetical protein